MFHKQFLTLLMAAAVSVTMAFSHQEEDAPKQEPEQAKGALKATVENGKMFIIDADGEKREIDVSGARSIMIRQSNRMIDNDGDQDKESVGEAIIIGPDGEKTVIELDGTGIVELPGMQLPGMPEKFERFGMELAIPELRPGAFPADILMPGTFHFERGDVGKYMIGVHCRPVDGALRSHLKMDEGIGLLIHSVTPDSPAQAADLREHDILLYADDIQLGSVSDLTRAVELAGEEERAFSLALLREGAEQRVEVEPTERTSDNSPMVHGFPLNPGRIQIQQMGPGLILGQDEDLQESVGRLREQMRKMQEDMKQMIERDK